ncbi:MAG: IclR family transcriptional regulator [Aquificota bacterium]|nr:MAG: IclR family transcriptional regulator [Aquificota bacterium]
MYRKRTKKEYTVHNVDVAFSILFFVAKNPNTTISEIRKQVDTSIQQTEKILEVLVNRGYLNYNKKKKTYSLGIKNFEVGYSYLTHVDIRKIAKPYLQELGEKYKENIYLAIRSGYEIVYIDAYEVKRPVLVKSRVGKLLPMYASASGKIHLADMDEEELEDFFKHVKLIPFTRKTIIDKGKLEKHILDVKKNGYAIDDEEWEEEVRCLSVPVRDYTGKVAAGITLSAPSYRLDKEKLISQIKDDFLKTARELSERLGYTENE